MGFVPGSVGGRWALAALCMAWASACSSQQRRTDDTHSTASNAASDAGAFDAARTTARANPCGNPCSNPCSRSRPAARLPDGGINPEAIVGVCQLVPHTVAEQDAGAPTGTIDLDAVDRTLRRQAVTLRECYETAVLSHPWLGDQGGTVNVRFIVEANGRVRGHPEATGIDEVPSVASCLASRIRYITFPAPAGGAAEVTLPFNFGAGG